DRLARSARLRARCVVREGLLSPAADRRRGRGRRAGQPSHGASRPPGLLPRAVGGAPAARRGGRGAASTAREPAVCDRLRRQGRVNTRCAYVDLDGTLLGRGASLLHDGEGSVSIEGVRAVQACLRAGVELVLMSGRRRAQVAEPARLLGQSSYIFEAGACVVLEGEEHWLTGDLLPGELTIAQQIELSGAPSMLLER